MTSRMRAVGSLQKDQGLRGENKHCKHRQHRREVPRERLPEVVP
jgi:hypothetical protein